MARVYTPAMRVVVIAALLAATAALLHVTVRTARAAGALAIGSCGTYGEAHDFHSINEDECNALAKCKGEACRVLTRCRAAPPRSPSIMKMHAMGTAGARPRGLAPRTNRCARAA